MRGHFEFGQERLENPVQILDDIVVPDADHAIAECEQRAVAAPVLAAFRVLASRRPRDDKAEQQRRHPDHPQLDQMRGDEQSNAGGKQSENALGHDQQAATLESVGDDPAVEASAHERAELQRVRDAESQARMVSCKTSQFSAAI